MKKGLFITSAMVLLLVFLVQYAASGNQKAEAVSQEQIRQNMHRIQIPFIANNGQMDERVTFYANTFGGTVFVTKDGEIVYALPNNNSDVETQGIASLKHSPDKIQQCRGELHSPDVIHDARQISDLHSPTSNSQTHNSKLVNSELQGIALKETLIGAKVKEIKGEDKSAKKVNYFIGNDQKKWKSNISTYNMVDLGEVYKGIELKLKAYGNNVEKLFYVKPGANPDRIKINLSGVKECVVQNAECGIENPKFKIQNPKLSVNEQGQLVAETELGPVAFTKPVAYQEIDGKRVDVGVEYEIYAVPQVVHRKGVPKNAKESIVGNTESAGNVCPPLACLCVACRQAGVKGVERDSPHVIQPTTNPKSKIVNLSSTEIGHPKLEYGFKVASYDKTKELVIDPLLASTFLGGTNKDYANAIAFDSSGNVYVTGQSYSSDYLSTTSAYQISNNGSHGNVIISKLNSDLTTLLASTYIGGSYSDHGYSIGFDSSGNVYVAGTSDSSDYPTTIDAYQTSISGSGVIVSKLNSDLTILLASTYIGGSYIDYGYSIALDSSGNVYVVGATRSSDYPTTTGAYQTIFNSSGDNPDVVISKLNSELTNLLASTYLGGYSSDEGYSISLDGSGNVYITGQSSSGDYPTTTDAYQNFFNGDQEIIISKLNSELTNLLASTYLGGNGNDYGTSLVIDDSGNVYVTGYSHSSDYPTTTGAYQTSNKSTYQDGIISKLNNDLTTLLASTYIGGSRQDNLSSLAVDNSGNVYVTGNSYSSDYPTTTGAYQTSYSGSLNDVIVSKLNSDLTTLKASTYLGSYIGSAIALDKTGNVYVTGSTDSSNFPISSDGYDSSFNGGSYDIFVSKLDSDLSSSPPSVTTDSATDITINSTTLNGTVNANNRSTTVWFEYGLYTGLYDYSTSTKTISGSTDQAVSVDIYNLYAGTTYYYQIVAENEIGTTYGDEMSFTTLSDTTKPSGSISINNGNPYTNSANVTLKLSASDDVGITGYYISTNSSTPSSSSSGWTSISSTTNYSASILYTLDDGDGSKTIYVWYKDGAGNISDIYSDSIILDTTPPEITITSPTTNDTYSTTISVVSLWGNASDATSGIASIIWSNNQGGKGAASGTASWSISNIGLLVDVENVITVTAKDNAGNSASDTITVTYSEPTTLEGKIFGYVMDEHNTFIASVKVTCKGKNTGVKVKGYTNKEGYFEFNNLDADTYKITAKQKGYYKSKYNVNLEEGEEKEIEIVLEEK
ncbi:SBBP repeat-containing protein [Candidatus Kuenenia sp.]|uniref:SBBP repeat-containing protein n=1 Tax=Candidatus Kuenenia sp. TaxID=2499824 RepID=UPI00321F97A4